MELNIIEGDLSYCLPMVGLRPSSLMFRGCVASLREG